MIRIHCIDAWNKDDNRHGKLVGKSPEGINSTQRTTSNEG